MRATARRTADPYRHDVDVRDHRLIIDEPEQDGGGDRGPTPQELLAASLAGCVAITMEMYAERKGWEIGAVAVSVDLEVPDRGPAIFRVNLQLPATCSEEQRERLRVIATKCPIHRLLEGDVSFEERVTIIDPLEN